MPNTNSYRLVIDVSALEEKKSVVAKSNGTGAGSGTAGKSDGADLQGTMSKVEKNAGKAVLGMVSYATASSFADRLITNELSVVELSTGAREYEQRLQFGYSVGKTAVNAAVALGVGIGTGTWPIVLAGLAVAGVGKLMEINQNTRRLNMSENLEDISIGFANTRAGVSGRRGQNQ